MPEEQSTVAQWQRITIYRYTLPPPYEATEHLFEELPLSTYPSGTTMEPLAYEMEPGATSAVRHRGTRRWPCFLGVSRPGGQDHEQSGCPFVRRVTEAICVRMTPNGCPANAKSSVANHRSTARTRAASPYGTSRRQRADTSSTSSRCSTMSSRRSALPTGRCCPPCCQQRRNLRTCSS